MVAVLQGRTRTARAVSTELQVGRTGKLDGTAALLWPHDLHALAGHYPGFPIVPGVFLVETADRAVRTVTELAELPDMIWSGIRSTRFLRPVFPGDRVTVEVKLSDGDGARTARCALAVEGDAVASVTLTYSTSPPSFAQPDAAAEPVAPVGVDQLAHGERDVSTVLPHRAPMLLVDAAVNVVPRTSITAVRTVRADEWCLRDAPADSGYPWPLVVESWCQSAGLLGAWEQPNPDVHAGQVMLFGGISGITFGTPVMAGQQMTHHVVLERDLGDVLMMSGHCTVDGRTVMTAERITMAMRPAEALLPTTPDTVEEKTHGA